MKNQLLLFITLMAFMSIALSGCIYQAGGAKTYDVQADTEEGTQYVNDNRVKYISPDIYGLYNTDFYRTEGFFGDAVSVSNDQILYGEVVSAELVAQYGLKPKYTFWENYGKFILIPLIIIGLIIYGKLNSGE